MILLGHLYQMRVGLILRPLEQVERGSGKLVARAGLERKRESL
jgi:hypothetical protein